MIWLIAATKLRFGKVGRILAGEFMSETTTDKELYMMLSGVFLKNFLFLCYSVIIFATLTLFLSSANGRSIIKTWMFGRGF